MREAAIEAYLVKRVKSMGGEVRKVAWVGRRGAPDRLVMLPSRQKTVDAMEYFGIPYLGGLTWTFWVELKAPGVKAEPHQLREHEKMRKVGQVVHVVDSLAGVDALFE